MTTNTHSTNKGGALLQRQEAQEGTRRVILGLGLMAFCVLGSLRTQAATPYSVVGVAADATQVVDLGDASANKDKLAYYLDAGSTLKVTGDASQSMLFSVWVTNGVATLDLTEVVGDEARWQGNYRANNGCSMSVSGKSKLVMGTATIPASIASWIGYSNFSGELAFADTTGAGLVFTNGFCFGQLPSCAWSVATNAVVTAVTEKAVDAGAPLLDAEGNLSLEDWDFYYVNRKAVASDIPIKVGEGRSLYVRVCAMPGDQKWDWGGLAGEAVSQDVALGGPTARLAFINTQKNNTFQGAISGTGDVVFLGGGGAFTVAGDLSFMGTVRMLSNDATLSVAANSPGDPANDVVLSGVRTTFSFQPTGYGSTATAVSMGGLSGAATNETFFVPARQTVTATSLSGKIHLAGDGVGATLAVGTIADKTTVLLADGVTLRANALGTGVTIYLEGDRASFAGPTEGEAIAPTLVPLAGETTLSLGGKLAFSSLPDTVTALELSADADVQVTTSADVQLTSAGGRLTVSPDTWKDKVAFWADASDADSFTYLREVNAEATSVPENGVLWWRDRRPEQTTYAFAMSRFATSKTEDINKAPSMYPLRKTDAESLLNGLPIMSFAGNNQRRMGILSVGTTLNNNGSFRNVKAEYVIAAFRRPITTFGASVLSSPTGYFFEGAVGGSSTKDATLDSNRPMFTNETITVHLNGVQVPEPTVTGFGSEWGIYSFTAETDINGICACATPNANPEILDGIRVRSEGGFEYAELLIFSEAPTESERQLAERYLSQKWGLPVTHANPYVQTIAAAGTGTLALGETASTELTGSFGGTVMAGEGAFTVGAPHAFTIPAGATRATNALTVTGAAVTLPTPFTVNLAFEGAVTFGEAVLLEVPAGTACTPVLGTVSGVANGQTAGLAYDVAMGRLTARVVATGTMLIFR